MADQLARVRRRRLDEVCDLLDPVEERALAEEGLKGDFELWPDYRV